MVFAKPSFCCSLPPIPLKPSTQFNYASALCLIPLILGLGVYPLLGLGLALSAFTITNLGFEPFWQNKRRLWNWPGFWIFAGLLIVFACCYRGFYIPYHPEILKMPWGYFSVLFTLSALTIFWVSCLSKNSDLINFIWYFSFGALLFCLFTIGITGLLAKPPFYGRVIDIRYLITGSTQYINTPGIANLLCLFPIVFISGLILNSNLRPRWFWPIGVIGLILSLISALAIGQRSYFVVCFLMAPVIVSIFLLLIRAWRPSLILITLLAIYPSLLLIDKLLGIQLLHRPVNRNLLSDARFEMFQFWTNHLFANPFQRIEVGPPPWDSLQWFHNFFADIHRLSGFWALLAAVILVAYIFYRVLCVISKEQRIGLFLMAVAIPNFLIMNTSVVPEGERQPFLLLLAIGAISEVILANLKHASSTKPNNDLINSNPK